ncbi:MAG: hypothetical protein ACP5JJ_06850 [Anaerolineae bacterium]
MNHRVESLVWLNDKGDGLGARRVRRPVIGLAVLVLVVLGITAALVIVQANVSSEFQGVVDANSIRWSALGAAYAPDYEAIADVSSARYQALATYYGAGSAGRERGVAADAARWQALADDLSARYERSHTAASARYQALGEWYMGQVAHGK